VDGRLQVEAILADAAGAAGSDDFGDDWFLGPLGVWVEDLQDGDVNDFGRRFMRSLAVNDLVRRVRVLAELRAHPEITDVTIPPIVYITGLERSGTTLLHNLLALHRDARVLRRWELMEPLPPPATATYDSDPRIAMVQEQVDQLRGTTLEQMHWVNATDPEECVWGFIDAVSMLGQAAALCMPRWNRFLAEEDLTPAFRNHRRLVQLLLWRHPVGPDGFLVLKAPQLAVHIRSFATVFPEARFVITDRDPYRCVASLAMMGAWIVDPFCDVNPIEDDGRRGRRIMHQAAAKLASVASFSAAEPSRVMHVGYPDLVRDPTEVVGRVFASDPEPDAELAARVSAFLDGQRSGVRAAPPPELDAMGYEQSEVWADPAIRDYCDRFGIEPERTRLTGAAPPS
jgi:hypothetical protein